MTSSNLNSARLRSPQLRGYLTKNKKKKAGSNQPDYRGSGSVSPQDFMTLADLVTSNRINFNEDGTIKLDIAGWVTQNQNTGNNILSIQIGIDTYRRPEEQSIEFVQAQGQPAGVGTYEPANQPPPQRAYTAPGPMVYNNEGNPRPDPRLQHGRLPENGYAPLPVQQPARPFPPQQQEAPSYPDDMF